jgi:hypothetical protein
LAGSEPLPGNRQRLFHFQLLTPATTQPETWQLRRNLFDLHVDRLDDAPVAFQIVLHEPGI